MASKEDIARYNRTHKKMMKNKGLVYLNMLIPIRDKERARAYCKRLRKNYEKEVNGG